MFLIEDPKEFILPHFGYQVTFIFSFKKVIINEYSTIISILRWKYNMKHYKMVIIVEKNYNFRHNLFFVQTLIEPCRDDLLLKFDTKYPFLPLYDRYLDLGFVHFLIKKLTRSVRKYGLTLKTLSWVLANTKEGRFSLNPPETLYSFEKLKTVAKKVKIASSSHYELFLHSRIFKGLTVGNNPLKVSPLALSPENILSMELSICYWCFHVKTTN